MGHNQIAREILEHHGSLRIDVMLVEEALIGGGLGLRDEVGGDDVENILEHLVEAERLGGAQRVVARAIGQDQLAAGQGRDGAGERMVRDQRPSGRCHG